MNKSHNSSSWNLQVRGNGMNSLDTRVKGFLFVMLTCITYGIMPALTQLSYQAGLSVSTMLFGRLFLGALLIWMTIIIKRLKFKVDKKHLGFMMLTGCASVVQMISMSESYRFLPGVIVSLLLFLYVSVVVIIEILIGREEINKTRIICLFCSFIGLILVIWTPGQGILLSGAGVVLVLVAAFFYGLYAIGLGEKRTRALDSEVVIGYMLIPPIFFSLIRCIASGEPLLPQTPLQGMYILLLAFFCLFIAAVSFAKGVKYIGSSNAAIFNTFEPVVAYFAGILFMNDSISTNAILGGLLILGTIIFLNLEKRLQSLKPGAGMIDHFKIRSESEE
ncbi:MAG TPA: DMT family transporter [Anaerovoracaceae bacterium]|nr:DMT family transporter [Anaerovoracaceae bacterium]